MSKVLIISGHPDLAKSHTNTLILDKVQSALGQASLRRLDSLYPDFRIDVAAEQQALLAAEVVVLQFPFYWYSVPALMKQWIDQVFAYDFAYGARGDKLKGKSLILSFTVGGPADSYDPQGYNHFTIEQLVRPLQQTAYLAGMDYQPPVYSHQMVYIPGVYNTLEAVQDRAAAHAGRLIDDIERLCGSAEQRIRQFVARWFAQFDQLPEQSAFFTGHLAADVHWQMPEGAFKGHQGFRDWYAMARKTFKPGCDHQLEQVTVTEHAEGYELALRIRLVAETFDDSPFDGAPVNLLVNETWQVALDAEGKVIIRDYRVMPVSTPD